MSIRSRSEAVLDLLYLRRPLEDVARDLGEFPFDCEPAEVQILTRAQAVRLLEAFVNEELALDNLEYWAMLVESRNDIAYEADSEALKLMVCVLAHPAVHRPLDPDRAYDWLNALDSEAASDPPAKR